MKHRKSPECFLVPAPPVAAAFCMAGLALAALSGARAEDFDWPSFRGPGASGRGTGSPPVTWNVERGENVRFRTLVPGLGHSSPVIWGERLFVTSAVPDQGEPSLKVGLYGDIAPVRDDSAQSWKIFALDKRSGALLWERTAYHGQAAVKRHTKSTHANSTPATDGNHLVAFFGSEGLYAYDLDGTLLWQKSLGVLDSGFFRVRDAQWGFGSSPIISGDKVIVQVDVQEGSFLGAFDVRDGSELWRTPRADVPTWGTPAIAPYTGGASESLQVAVNGWKHIGGYDLATGGELWRLTGGGDIPVPTPIYADGLILITSAHGAQRPIYAIRTDAKGDITGNEQAIAWFQERAGNYMQTPLVNDGLAYFCFDNGVLSVYQLDTGERLYQQRLGGGTSGFTASPVAAAGRIYFTSEDGETHVVAAGRQFKQLAVNELGETAMATPAISEGVLYFRGQKHLIAIAEPSTPSTTLAPP